MTGLKTFEGGEGAGVTHLIFHVKLGKGEMITLRLVSRAKS